MPGKYEGIGDSLRALLNGDDPPKREKDVAGDPPPDFTTVEARAAHSGIVTKGFFVAPSEPPAAEAMVPEHYADFTNLAFPINTPEAVFQSRKAWDTVKAFSPDLYTADEAEKIESAIVKAEKDASDKPDMTDCPKCGKPVPKGTDKCPHCGAAISTDDGDDEDKTDGGDDEATEDQKKAFEAEAREMAEALIVAFDTGDRDEIVEATKAASEVSRTLVARTAELPQSEVQGILEHALAMGAECPTCKLTGSDRHDKSASPTLFSVKDFHSLRRENDRLAAALETANAAGGSDSALRAANEAREAAERETETLRLELETTKSSKEAIARTLQSTTDRLADTQRRQRPAVSRKSVAVGTPAMPARTAVQREVVPPPQTLDEVRLRRQAEAAERGR